MASPVEVLPHSCVSLAAAKSGALAMPLAHHPLSPGEVGKAISGILDSTRNL
jgi:hypothetical protein